MAELVFELDACLTRVRVPQVPVHRCQIHQRDRRRDFRERIRKSGCTALARREADDDLLEILEIGGVFRRKQRVRKGAERHAIVKQPHTCADERSARVEWRPCDACTRRDVIGICFDRLQELEIVPDAEIQRDFGMYLPLVLRVEADVRVRLSDARNPERLHESGVVIETGEKIRKRRERVRAAHGAWIRDLAVVVEEVDSTPERVRPGLV